MKPLFKKELNYYLNNPLGYIIVGLFAVFTNFLYIKDIFAVGQVSIPGFFSTVPWLFLIFIPALSMRSFAEEKKNNTIESLLTLPISETQIVLAKFLSILTVVSIGLLLTVALPVALMITSKLYLPEVLVGYIGLIFMGAMFIAVSMFFSTQTKNQIVALLISVLVLFFLLILNSDFNSGIFPKFVQDYLSYLSPNYHLQNFIKGVLDIRSIFYFISGTALFLFLTIIDLEKRD